MLSLMLVAEAVKALRAAYGETQQAFSHRLGISLGALTHYEGGQRRPDYLVTWKLYRAASKSGHKRLAAFFKQRRERFRTLRGREV